MITKSVKEKTALKFLASFDFGWVLIETELVSRLTRITDVAFTEH